ncbi:STM3941 family protein [Olivibacter sitiensis]|uniref:STM3941 family protein n=1 Tax=Olivibacter sitiensis TaxID=376470 RepID=UPI000403DB3C|nr:STM3941 family protein [Olivibacter sitiensis]
MEKITISLSRKKTAGLLVLGIAFVVLGLFFILTPETFTTIRMNSPLFVRGMGIVSVLFFGASTFYGVIKMFDKGAGLVVDEHGIYNNSNATNIGWILWEDITKIATQKVASTNFILIYVSNPEEYIDKAKGLKKKLMQANHNMYGTPLSITCNTLSYRFSELEELVMEWWKVKC